MFYSTDAVSDIPIKSLRDIVEYNLGLVKIDPYQGLLKGKENLNFNFGNGKFYPTPSEFDKF